MDQAEDFARRKRDAEARLLIAQARAAVDRGEVDAIVVALRHGLITPEQADILLTENEARQ